MAIITARFFFFFRVHKRILASGESASSLVLRADTTVGGSLLVGVPGVRCRPVARLSTRESTPDFLLRRALSRYELGRVARRRIPMSEVWRRGVDAVAIVRERRRFALDFLRLAAVVRVPFLRRKCLLLSFVFDGVPY